MDGNDAHAHAHTAEDGLYGRAVEFAKTRSDLPLTALAAHLGISKGEAVSLLDRLQRGGIVGRSTNGEPCRVLAISTPGASSAERCWPTEHGANQAETAIESLPADPAERRKADSFPIIEAIATDNSSRGGPLAGRGVVGHVASTLAERISGPAIGAAPPEPALTPDHDADPQIHAPLPAGGAAEFAAQFRIPTELLRIAGWRGVTDSEAREALGLNGERGADFGGLLIPYLHPLTGVLLGHRVRRNRETDTGKYRSTPALRWLYFAPAPSEWLADLSKPVVIVEAEKSALAGRAMDMRHGTERVWIATGGISGWKRRISKEPQRDGTLGDVTGPSPSLDLLRWDGRTAIVFRDSNVRGRRDLMKASGALAHELMGCGAIVRFADAPKLEGVNGPDDAIAACGDDAVLALLDSARPFAESALAEAEAALVEIERLDAAKRKTAVLPFAEFAAMDDEGARRRLISTLAALRISGADKSFIERETNAKRAEADAARRQAAEAARRGRLLGLRINGAALLDSLAAFQRAYVGMTAAQADVGALWLLHGHALEAFEYTPYLFITSPEKRCGKSRLLEALELLAARPWRSDRTTPAALLRSVERDQPTLLLDEWDAAKGSGDEYNEAMRGLLNSGFRRGGTYRLCVGEDREPRDFPTFCPKAIAGIGRLPDTVADRSLTIALRRKAAKEPVRRFRRRDAEVEAATLREKAEAWALQLLDTLRDAKPALPDVLNDRQQDIAEPLLAVADAAGVDWSERARRAIVELCAGGAAEDDSIGAKLLADMRGIFEAREAERIPSKELAEALGAMEDRPWAEWGRGAKPITAPQLARQLGRFGIAPRNLREGESVLKGYQRADFDDAWRRYLAPDSSSPSNSPDPNRYTATTRIDIERNGDFGNATPDPCTGSKNAISANKDAACSGVAVWYGQNGHGGAQAGPLPPEPTVPLRRAGRLCDGCKALVWEDRDSVLRCDCPAEARPAQ